MTTVRRRYLLLACSCLAAVACAEPPGPEAHASLDQALVAPEDPPPDDPPPDDPPPEDPDDPDLPECEPGGTLNCRRGGQGRALLGVFNPTALYHFHPKNAYWTVAGKPPLDPIGVGAKSIDEKGLKILSGGVRLTNLQLVGLGFGKSQGFPYCTKIAGNGGIDARGRQRFIVRFSSTCSTNELDWFSLCPNDYAYVAPGMFHPDGNIAWGDDGTFVCGKSAGGKSFRWGYSPYHFATGAEQKAYFHASTRAARADWCGMGVPGTIDGTPILVFDLLDLTLGGVFDPGENQPSTIDRPFLFEASWPGGGRNQPVVCLSKLRWKAMPPGGPCKDMLVNPLPDPRIRGSLGKYCEDLAGGANFRGLLTKLSLMGGRVFTASPLMDQSLFAWWSEDGSDHFATTRGFWATSADMRAPEDASDYVTALANSAADRSSYLAQVWANPGDHLVPLYVHRKTGGTERYTTTDPAPAGYDVGEIIGYVYDAESRDFMKPPMVPVLLRTWIKGDDRMLVAGDEGPPRIVGGWSLDRTEGYGFVIPGPKQ